MIKIFKNNLSIYYMLLACAEFALVGLLAKLLSASLPSIEIMFYRNLIGTLIMLVLIIRLKEKINLKKLHLLILRGVVGAIALYCFFYNVSEISLAGAFTFLKISPIFIAIFSFLFFKENIGKLGVLAIAIAFVGVMLILEPWQSMDLRSFSVKDSLIGLASGFFSALALLSVRRLQKYYSVPMVAFAFVFIASLMPALSMIIANFYSPKSLDFALAVYVPPLGGEWILILLMGILGATYQIHVTKAYGLAKKAAVVAGVGYMDVVFTLFLGLALGEGWPDFYVFIGIICIVGGGLLLIKK